MLAFQVAVSAVGADGKDITPVLWSDNYIELMPGETRDLSATLPANVNTNRTSVVVSGWNIPSQSLHLGIRPATRAVLTTNGRVKVN
jgi:exo-1,4-beta-D-glucosaminidase